MTRIASIATALVAAAGTLHAAQTADSVPPDRAPADVAPAEYAPVDVRLLDHEAERAELERLAAEHAELARVLPVAVSRAGRRVEALQLGARGDDDAPARPAILLVAGLEGPQAWTSSVALACARDLLERAATDDAARAFLETTTLYVVPRANPDAVEARFRAPLAEVLGTGHGVDDDRDGRSGEDGPEDVNGDGKITWIRVADPEGAWREEPSDPRVLVEADRAKGERGTWKLWPEGRDHDGDELVAEDPQLDAEVNRNFPARWEEHTPRAGLFPTDEPEARGLADFVIAHRDVQLVVVLGDQDMLVGEPQSVADDAPRKMRVPAPGVLKSDAELLAELGRRWAEIAEKPAKGTGSGEGTFQDWCYDHRGLLTLSLAPWTIPLDEADTGEQDSDEAGDEESATDAEGGDESEAPDEAEAAAEEEPKPSDDARRLAWLERNGVESAHLGWSAFDHPELGAVEVGGFAPYALVEPPEEQRARIAGEQVELLVSLGETLARVELVEATVADLGGGLLEIEAAVENDALLPLLTTSGKRTRTTRPAKVRLHLPEGATLVAGKSVELVSELPGAGGRHELRWLATGARPGEVGVSVESDHAGSATAVCEVKR